MLYLSCRGTNRMEYILTVNEAHPDRCFGYLPI